jgi:hypothetical protein
MATNEEGYFRTEDENILQEMKNDNCIYRYLKNKLEGNWSTLYYSGYIYGVYFCYK